jgi:hypothetical protein
VPPARALAEAPATLAAAKVQIVHGWPRLRLHALAVESFKPSY